LSSCPRGPGHPETAGAGWVVAELLTRVTVERGWTSSPVGNRSHASSCELAKPYSSVVVDSRLAFHHHWWPLHMAFQQPLDSNYASAVKVLS
jgi:hypothetical protein